MLSVCRSWPPWQPGYGNRRSAGVNSRSGGGAAIFCLARDRRPDRLGGGEALGMLFEALGAKQLRADGQVAGTMELDVQYASGKRANCPLSRC